jgi:hypothetical protein
MLKRGASFWESDATLDDLAIQYRIVSKRYDFDSKRYDFHSRGVVKTRVHVTVNVTLESACG